MTQHTPPAAAPNVTAHVWANLAADLRTHAVRLLAQLAYACATSPINHSVKESSDVGPSDGCKDPPRPS
jgi:hypothetical protein